MSKSREAHRRANQPAAQLTGGQGKHEQRPSFAPTDFPPPLKPQRALFFVMAILLMVLAGGLLTLYFKTVYPYRHDVHAIETDLPAGPPPAARK